MNTSRYLFPAETVRNACHGYIGSPIKDEHGIILGHGVRTCVRSGALHVTYRLNDLGKQRLGGDDVEVCVMVIDQ